MNRISTGNTRPPALPTFLVRPVEDGQARRCETCGAPRPDVRVGPDTGGRAVCNHCWACMAPGGGEG